MRVRWGVDGVDALDAGVMGHFRHPAVVREAAADHKDRAAGRDGREFGQVGPGAAQARELALRRGATGASELALRRRGATDASDCHPRGKHD